MMRKIFCFLIFALLFSISLCACTKNEPEMLPEPQNIQASNRVITWDPVENASGYQVTFDGEMYQTEESCFNYAFVKIADTYSFSVIALGDGKHYSNSAIVSEKIRVEPPVEHGFDDLGFEYTFDYDIWGYEINAGTADLSGTVVLPDCFGDWPVKRIAKTMFAAEGAWTHWTKTPDCFEERYCNKDTTAINLPAYLECIEGYAFAFVVNLEEIEIPDTVVEIQSGAFKGCKRLKRVVLPSNLKEISFQCFMHTGLSELVLPASLEVIRGSAFATPVESITNHPDQHVDSALTEIVIPASVKVIEGRAFKGRWNLASVILEENVEKLTGGCFGDTAWWDSQPDGFVYLKDFLYRYKGELPENARIEVPAGTKGICDYAFKDQKYLREIVLPEGIEHWGEGIFTNCVSLTTVSLPADMKSIPPSMFSVCSSLESVDLPNGITCIGGCAFQYAGLKSISIPASVASIGGYAFANCEALKEIILPMGVESIEPHFIESCNVLKALLIPTSVKEIDSYPFWRNDALTYIFYEGGTFDEFIKIFKIDFEVNEDILNMLKNDPIYYYSEEKPTEEGNYWHYVNGVPTPWDTE